MTTQLFDSTVRRLSLHCLATLVVLGTAVALDVAPATAAGRLKPLPPFAKVEKQVLLALSCLDDYQPGDILSRSQVEPIFKLLRVMGWTVSDRKAILNHVPDDRDSLVRVLRTPQGREFMRRVSKYPSAYDRLHRMAWSATGIRTVVQVIKEPNGHKLIESITTTSRGKQMAKRASKWPNARHIDKPTGKIYTGEQLVERLKQSYARDEVLRARALKVKKNTK